MLSYFHCVLKAPYFSIFLLFCGPFLYEHVVVEHLLTVVLQYPKHCTAQRNQPAQRRKASTCRSEGDNAIRQRASTVLQYRKHGTAQPNQPAQSRKASTCRSECDGATSRQSWREPAHAVKHLHNTLSSENERRKRNTSGLQKYTTSHTALV